MDRYTLAIDAIRRMNKFKEASEAAVREFQGKLAEHTRYIHENGEDLPEVRNWKWPA
jgi:xylulose-5-phosphate/fructose-6-phosphate phosphoketolase